MNIRIASSIRAFLLFLPLAFHPLTPAVPLEWVSWSSAPKVALTFDDGPHPESTALLSQILDTHRVPATFFVVGRVAARNPAVLRQLASAGHEISNHTWTHPDIRLISAGDIRRELDQTRALIESVTGQKTFLFRTPGSHEGYLRRRFKVPPGYQLVLWDVHSLDQEGLSADQIAQRVLAQIKNGDVVLMHNGLASTRVALETIIPELKRRGYEFVTVTGLLRGSSRAEASARRGTFLQG